MNKPDAAMKAMFRDLFTGSPVGMQVFRAIMKRGHRAQTVFSENERSTVFQLGEQALANWIADQCEPPKEAKNE